MKRYLLILLPLFLLGTPFLAHAAGGLTNTSYAWSSTTGWIHFGNTSYSVVADGTGILTGYAWSSNLGWISFKPEDVTGCPGGGSCQAKLDKTTGKVTGWARALAGRDDLQKGGWDGWIHLSGTNYGVTVVGCSWTGYAWGGGSSPDSGNNGVLGWIKFSDPSAGYGVTGTGDACSSLNSPNLTAGAITPTTVKVNTATSMTATITNNGNAATGGTFTNLLQIATTPDESDAADSGTDNVPALAGNGATESSSISHTFTTEGTYKVRICADKSSAANTGQISESDENDNCGPWTDVVVNKTGTGGEPDVLCEVTSPDGTLDVNTDITWTATPSGFPGTPQYLWSDPNGTPSAGSANPFVTQYSTNGTYSPSVTAKYGATFVTKSCTPATVGLMCGVPTKPTITATPNRVVAGTKIGVGWNATNVNSSCVITGPNIGGRGINSLSQDANSCGVQDTAHVQVDQKSTFCITCDGNTSLTQCAIVNVLPKFQEF